MTRLPILLLVFALAVTGCGPSGPLMVSSVQLGRTINSDDSVGTHATRFKPEETVYAAVLTEGAGAGTIKARWSFSGRTVSEESKEVAYRESAATEFHLQYAGGLPPGSYRVEIEVDGTPAGARDFQVAR